MSEPATKKKISSSMFPDWSQLHEDLLHNIIKKLENCFNVIHARSVCTSWRSSVPFPSCLVSPSYSLPSFNEESKALGTLKKVPLFLVRVRAPSPTSAEYFLGGIGRYESKDHTKLSSPIQCSVKLTIPGFCPTLINMLDCQVFHVGHQYMICRDHENWRTSYGGVAVLPLNKKGGGKEFVMLLNYYKVLLVLRSAEMRWMPLKKLSDASCKSVVTFRGRFYALFDNGDIFVIDPYSLEATPLMPSQSLSSKNYLVQSGNDELFLVRDIIPPYFCQLTCIVSRLDEEAGKWVEVNELGDRVFFIGNHRNVACSAKELPAGCGVNGNSILFTNHAGNVVFPYKYGLHIGSAEVQLCFFRSRENPVHILNRSRPVLTLRIKH